MPAARSALENLLDTIRQALAPVAVGLAGQAGDTDQDDAEVLLTPVSLRRVGRSRRAGALLDLELTVAVTAQGPDAIDHLERLLVLAETRGLTVASAPEPPDFTHVAAGSYVLGNIGPDEPFGGGEPDLDFDLADPATTGQVMQFRVVPTTAADPSTPPANLVLPTRTPLPAASVTRRLVLAEMMSMHFDDAPVAALLGTVDGDPGAGPAAFTPRMWHEPITENPTPGTPEIWEFHNATADAHPIHVHETKFEVVNRQTILVDEDAMTVQVTPGSTPMLPEPWEAGTKDTVVAYPGQVTRIKVRFTSAGQYVWHCHIVEHEDNEMMRPFRVGPTQAGQP